MVNAVQVKLGERSYPILIGEGILAKVMQNREKAEEVALVTDAKVAQLKWFSMAEASFKSRAEKYVRLVVPSGEKSKDLKVYAKLCSQLARKSFTRRCVIVALGGGVVGDLAGFLAATYLRGVRLIQIPTTLLSAVDSSVGGKTGTNLPEGKNLVGAFYQPSCVVIDAQFLKTLPKREFAAGMAEVLKYGLTRDRTLWNGLAAKKLSLPQIIRRCVQIKAEIVGKDERDVSGERALLNFGHTVGHAIEQNMRYGKFLHGEAISIGMVAAAMLSEKVFGLPKEATEQIRKVLRSYKLPIHAKWLSYKHLHPAIVRDKKSTGKNIQWVLLKKIGRAALSTAVTPQLLRQTLQGCRHP